jgi:hypothetical protein
VLDALGWIATALFVSSYFCKSQDVLRRVQAVAALLWIGYGVAIGSGPVIASNVLVASIAAYSSFARRGGAPEGRPDPAA